MYNESSGMVAVSMLLHFPPIYYLCVLNMKYITVIIIMVMKFGSMREGVKHYQGLWRGAELCSRILHNAH